MARPSKFSLEEILRIRKFAAYQREIDLRRAMHEEQEAQQVVSELASFWQATAQAIIPDPGRADTTLPRVPGALADLDLKSIELQEARRHAARAEQQTQLCREQASEAQRAVEQIAVLRKRYRQEMAHWTEKQAERRANEATSRALSREVPE